MNAAELKKSESKCMVGYFKEKRYDVRALIEELNSVFGLGYGDLFHAKEQDRLEQLEENALFLIATLFVCVTFVLLTMAMLALKMLSMLTEDRARCRTLWRLGADEGTLRKTLFSQTFFFFFLPFAVPFAMFFPLVWALKKISIVLMYENVNLLSIALQVTGVAGMFLALYALYFTVTYLVAWWEIKKAVRSVG